MPVVIPKTWDLSPHHTTTGAHANRSCYQLFACLLHPWAVSFTGSPLAPAVDSRQIRKATPTTFEATPRSLTAMSHTCPLSLVCDPSRSRSTPSITATRAGKSKPQGPCFFGQASVHGAKKRDDW